MDLQAQRNAGQLSTEQSEGIRDSGLDPGFSRLPAFSWFCFSLDLATLGPTGGIHQDQDLRRERPAISVVVSSVEDSQPPSWGRSGVMIFGYNEVPVGGDKVS